MRRLRIALRAVCAQATAHNSIEQAASDLRAQLSRTRRCRPEPFKKLAATPKERFDTVVCGMVDHRSSVFVKAMSGLPQQTKCIARGFKASQNFTAIAYLYISKLKHLPTSSFAPAMSV